MAKKKNNSDYATSNNSSSFAKGTRNIDQLIAPAAITYTSEHEIKVENNYARSFVINAYPSRVNTLWLDNLYSYNGDMDVAVHIEPADEKTALAELTDKITQYEAQLATETERGSIRNITSLTTKIKTLYEQRAQLEQAHESMFHVETFCTMYGKDIRELNKAAQVFQNHLAGSRMGIMPLTLRQDEGFKTVSPFGLVSIPDYYRNMNTGALSTMFPFYNADITQSNGIFLGINRLRNTPLFIDLFNKNAFLNANMSIFGTSGAGKTYLTSLITNRYTLQSVRTVIIDPENEYTACTESVGGISIKISPGSENMINPFDIDEEVVLDNNNEPTNEKYVDIKGKVSDLLGLLAVMYGQPLNGTLMATLSEVLMDLYTSFGFTRDPDSLFEENSAYDAESGSFGTERAYKRMPTMSDFERQLRDYVTTNGIADLEINSFLKMISLYTKGDGGIYDLFDCETSFDISEMDTAPVIRFDIKDIEDDVLRPIGMHIVLTWVWNKFIKKDFQTRKRIVCDEAWLLLHKSMAGSDYTSLFLEKCARRIRKYNGSLCCASQNFREFVGREEGLAILANSAVKAFLKQAPEDIEAVGDKFIMSEGEKNFLLTAKRGELLLKVGQESIIADVFAFQFEHEMIARKYLESKE